MRKYVAIVGAFFANGASASTEPATESFSHRRASEAEEEVGVGADGESVPAEHNANDHMTPDEAWQAQQQGNNWDTHAPLPPLTKQEVTFDLKSMPFPDYAFVATQDVVTVSQEGINIGIEREVIESSKENIEDQIADSGDIFNKRITHTYTPPASAPSSIPGSRDWAAVTEDTEWATVRWIRTVDGLREKGLLDFCAGGPCLDWTVTRLTSIDYSDAAAPVAYGDEAITDIDSFQLHWNALRCSHSGYTCSISLSTYDLWTYPRVITGPEANWLNVIMLNETHYVTLYQEHPSGTPYIRMGTRDKMWEPLHVVVALADNLKIARVDCNHIVVAYTHEWKDKGHGAMAIFAIDPEQPSGWSRKFVDVFNGDRTDSFDLKVVEPHGIVLAYMSIRQCQESDYDCDTRRAHIRSCKVFSGFLDKTVPAEGIGFQHYNPQIYFNTYHAVRVL